MHSDNYHKNLQEKPQTSIWSNFSSPPFSKKRDRPQEKRLGALLPRSCVTPGSVGADPSLLYRALLASQLPKLTEWQPPQLYNGQFSSGKRILSLHIGSITLKKTHRRQIST